MKILCFVEFGRFFFYNKWINLNLARIQQAIGKLAIQVVKDGIAPSLLFYIYNKGQKCWTTRRIYQWCSPFPIFNNDTHHIDDGTDSTVECTIEGCEGVILFSDKSLKLRFHLTMDKKLNFSAINGWMELTKRGSQTTFGPGVLVKDMVLFLFVDVGNKLSVVGIRVSSLTHSLGTLILHLVSGQRHGFVLVCGCG